MPESCSIPGCTSRRGKGEACSLHFYHLPSNPDVRQCWLVSITDLNIQSSTYSHYKHHNTFKAISPSGAVTFISRLYGGATSDKEITRASGLLIY